MPFRLSPLAASCAVLLAAPLCAAAAPAAKPASIAAAARDSIARAIDAEREETKEWLRSSPTSYLATVQRRDFGERTSLVVGRAEGVDVRIDDPEIAPRHLRVTVAGDSFGVEALAPEARFKVRDSSLTAATLPPSSIKVGRFTLRLSHQRFPALIVFDPKSPRYQEYKGMRWFPVDLAYRYELPLTANPAPDTVIIQSTRGNPRRAVRVGWFDFTVGKKPVRLEATRLLEPGVGEGDFGLFFRDATSGKETYELGRYLDLQPAGNGRWVLDFNNAYNPACAYSDHYNCPIPPRANRLAIAIRAGEMDSHYMKH